MPDAKICVVCAWRESCQKKFSISKREGAHCPDFSRDLRLRAEDPAPAAAQDPAKG